MRKVVVHADLLSFYWECQKMQQLVPTSLVSLILSQQTTIHHVINAYNAFVSWLSLGFPPKFVVYSKQSVLKRRVKKQLALYFF